MKGDGHSTERRDGPHGQGPASGRRLQQKIFVRTSVLTTFLVTVSCASLALRAVYDQRSSEQERLKTISAVLAHEIRPLIGRASTTMLSEVLGELVKSHDTMLYAVVLRQNTIYAASVVRPDLGFEDAWVPLHGAHLQLPSVATLRTTNGLTLNDAAVPLGEGDDILRLGMVRPGIDEKTIERIAVSILVSLATLILGIALSWSIAVATTREVSRAESALRESERRYRLLFDQAPDSILLVDFTTPAHPKVMAANEATERVYGHKRDEIVGMDLSSLVAPSDRGQLEDRITSLEAGGVVAFEGLHAQKKDGTELPVDVTAQLVHVEGRPVLQAMARDISERKRAEEEKHRLEAELQQAQKMEAIGRLAGGVAHDMNNTLGAIMGTASVMRSHVAASDPHVEHLENILQACQRGQELTRDLLGFARKGKYVRKPISLNDLANETTNLLRRTAPKNVRIEVALAERLSAVEGDPGQLSHALMNVCVNALDAMGETGVLTVGTSEVLVSADGGLADGWKDVPEGRYVELRVVDTGEGMDEATLARAFEPFFTTKPRGAGTGLGLSMVLGVVKSHGGFIRVRSTLGEGTTVSWLLPRTERTPEVAERPARSSTRKAKGGVLLVEDEVLIRWSAKKMLEELGYTVFAASNGLEGLELYGASRAEIDVVVLDLIMPGMDGAATFEGLRRINPEVRVLIASGFTEDRKVDDLLRQGASGFVEKPFDLHLLGERLGQILDNAR